MLNSIVDSQEQLNLLKHVAHSLELYILMPVATLGTKGEGAQLDIINKFCEDLRRELANYSINILQLLKGYSTRLSKVAFTLYSYIE